MDVGSKNHLGTDGWMAISPRKQMKGDLGLGRPCVVYHSVIRNGWMRMISLNFFIFHIV